MVSFRQDGMALDKLFWKTGSLPILCTPSWCEIKSLPKRSVWLLRSSMGVPSTMKVCDMQRERSSAPDPQMLTVHHSLCSGFDSVRRVEVPFNSLLDMMVG